MIAAEPKHKVNTEYFHALLKDREISLRTLAKKIDLEPGALSLTFRGERGMKLREANEIALVLGVPLKEVLHNAGVENVITGERTIPVIGTLRGGNVASVDFRVTGERVAGPPDLPEVAYAVLAQTAMTELAPMDGWMFFIGQPQHDFRNLIARSVFAKPAGESCVVYGHLGRSHKQGLYNILPHAASSSTAQALREAVDLEWAAPVLWIRPQ